MFLLSLIGIPVTGGFFAKFYVFSAAMKSNLVGLTIIGVINSAIAAYYYLRIIVYMYMRDQRTEAPWRASSRVRDRTGNQPDCTIYLGVSRAACSTTHFKARKT